MRIIVAAVGRPKDGALATAIQEYERRAARYWPLDVVEVREERGGAGISASHVMEREGARLCERIPAGATVMVCDADGPAMSSPDFARWMQRYRESATDVAFVVGGAHGLSPAVHQRAAGRLSLSSMTFPHEVARLMLVEQLYRAGTILRGEPYHK